MCQYVTEYSKRLEMSILNIEEAFFVALNGDEYVLVHFKITTVSLLTHFKVSYRAIYFIVYLTLNK